MLNTVEKSSDTVGLSKLYDYLLVNIGGTGTLGVKESLFSSMLSQTLFWVLPHDIVVRYHRMCAAEVSAQRTYTSQKNADLGGVVTRLVLHVASRNKTISKTSKGASVCHVKSKAKAHRPY
ncbi:hypothetical protein HPB48_011049 [Haemaphysalis longicornis]|uniref:Uncharacterized protein n=1 Tax=Haemaphysalis longicornis TaxID=44386 RepID=A0A9J6GWM7_HAELO|nr:hypothetical protein HPB48_011049 [Haemaphysalis longicornis]